MIRTHCEVAWCKLSVGPFCRTNISEWSDYWGLNLSGPNFWCPNLQAKKCTGPNLPEPCILVLHSRVPKFTTKVTAEPLVVLVTNMRYFPVQWKWIVVDFCVILHKYVIRADESPVTIKAHSQRCSWAMLQYKQLGAGRWLQSHKSTHNLIPFGVACCFNVWEQFQYLSENDFCP